MTCNAHEIEELGLPELPWLDNSHMGTLQQTSTCACLRVCMRMGVCTNSRVLDPGACICLYPIEACCERAGLTCPIERKREIYAVCSEYDVVIVEDDPYWYLQFGCSKFSNNQEYHEIL